MFDYSRRSRVSAISWSGALRCLGQRFLPWILALLAAGSPCRAQSVTNVVYGDSLATNWQNWSWGTNLNFSATPAHTGKYSIAVTYTGGWVGLYLDNPGVSLSGYQNLQFWIDGGAGGGQAIWVSTTDTSGRNPVQISISPYIQGGSVGRNGWQEVSIPLSVLGAGSYPLTGIIVQNATDASQGTFYLDDIELTGNGVATPPPPFQIPPFGPKTPAYPSAQPVGDIPAAWPTTFALGLASPPGETPWMKASGAEWKFRYQYLCGGVNTGTGWSTWNSPDGQFATDYLNESAAAGDIPVFTYYQILQSNPLLDQENLPSYQQKFMNVAAMAAYYADWKLLMQKCGEFGKPVVVHVEPDLWGYMQQTTATPQEYKVEVDGSKFPEVAGLPNDAQGFAEALVLLRKKYAPNVILALHASMWSSKIDVGSNRDASLDVAAQANATAKWLNGLGEGWDLCFTDFADRDAAYKQLVESNPGTWWDETNAQLPNFHQAEYWMSVLNHGLQRRLVVWQVPIGNTKARSCDNSHEHYQDNRVQYYLDSAYGKSHIQELVNSGAIAILFGRGDGNTTSYDDSAGDGVTNPAPIDGNDLEETVTDDDGGYLRTQAKAYTAAALGLR